MSVDPGIMSQMPSLPVLIDYHLFQSILPLANQVSYSYLMWTCHKLEWLWIYVIINCVLKLGCHVIFEGAFTCKYFSKGRAEILVNLFRLEGGDSISVTEVGFHIANRSFFRWLLCSSREILLRAIAAICLAFSMIYKCNLICYWVANVNPSFGSKCLYNEVLSGPVILLDFYHILFFCVLVE